MAKKLYLFLGSIFALGGFEILISKIMAETYTLAVSSTLFVLASLATVLFFSEKEKERQQQEKVLSETQDKNILKLDEVKLAVETLRENDKAHNEVIRNLTEKYNDSITALNNISGKINELIAENQTKMNSYLEILKDIQEQTNSSIEENFETVSDMLKKNIRQIVDSIDDYESDISDEIKKLANQYDEFKKFTDAAVEKITLTNKNDLDALRKILNG